MRRLATAVVAATLWAGIAAAEQPLPNPTILLIHPYAAGGPADLLARPIAERMSAVLGAPVVVESRPGAGTAIAAALVARADADGYTIFIGRSQPQKPASSHGQNT